ncbi:hypothetical protein D9M72_517360 [compost metagenome]
MALAGPLAELEAVRAQLGQGVVVPCGDQVEPLGHQVAPLLQRRSGPSLDLGATDGLAGVAAQAGQAADRLGEETAVGPCDAYMPVVQLALERYREPDAESGQEVTLGIAVPDEGVDHPHAAGSGVEVEPDYERQPAAPVTTVVIRAV